MKEKTRVAIVGSHGLYANYGGWDQLVRNLAEKKSSKIEYLIFNSADSPKNIVVPTGVTVKHMIFKASGFQGLFYDYWSILSCFNTVDTILFLGVQGIIIIPFITFLKRLRIISNTGGIEWERPKFNFFAKQYLRLCFNLSFLLSEYVVLDNPYYNKYLPKYRSAKVKIIPYGGEIDKSMDLNKSINEKYPFINKEFILSISRSLKDNLLDQLCESFVNSEKTLVLISNFSKSPYGNKVWNKYKNISNIFLINGLYKKLELDLIRRKCTAYIHTHTLCGTAPSLVEMIIAQKPIFSIDNPQNRFTLENNGFYFSSFSQIHEYFSNKKELNDIIPPVELCKRYDWQRIVTDYESMFYTDTD